MNIVYEIKCPECGSVIEYDEIFDSYSDEYCLVNYCVGHCTKCDTQFQWEDFKVKF